VVVPFARLTASSRRSLVYLQTYGATSFTCNLAGELTRSVTGTDTTRYSYTSWGQVRSVVLPTGVTVVYGFDEKGFSLCAFYGNVG
jgi:YD repeat-containing protein